MTFCILPPLFLFYACLLTSPVLPSPLASWPLCRSHVEGLEGNSCPWRPFSAEIEPNHCVLPSACVHVGRARGSLCEIKLAWAIDGSMFGYMYNAIAGLQTAWSLTGSGAKGQGGRNLVPFASPHPPRARPRGQAATKACCCCMCMDVCVCLHDKKDRARYRRRDA